MEGTTFLLKFCTVCYVDILRVYWLLICNFSHRKSKIATLLIISKTAELNIPAMGNA